MEFNSNFFFFPLGTSEKQKCLEPFRKIPLNKGLFIPSKTKHQEHKGSIESPRNMVARSKHIKQPVLGMSFTLNFQQSLCVRPYDARGTSAT